MHFGAICGPPSRARYHPPMIRLCLILPLLAIGCSSSSSSGTSPDSGVDAGACFGATVDSVPYKLCKNDGDCTLKPHQTDCCGSVTMVGLANAVADAYDRCEAAWDKHFSACGCPPGPTKAEDGADVGSGTLTVKCTNFTSSGGVCQTSVTH